MSVKAVEVVVAGRVQGVFFRASCAEQAERLDVTGWVANRLDGSVAGHFEGRREAVEELVDWCRHGPPRAWVAAVDVAEVEPAEHDRFESGEAGDSVPTWAQDQFMTINADSVHLRHCITLAVEALEAGDDPFGSMLVDADGDILAEARNLEHTKHDPTAHPELALARWAAAHLPVAERAGTTVYTSGEHCPMCAAAHAWVGLGRIVYAASSAQLASWRSGWGLPDAPVRTLPITEIAPALEVVGPISPYDEEMRRVHERAVRR